MITMANFGIGFKQPLTRPGVKLDEKISICSPESEKMSCHAILKNLYRPRMDVILTLPACRRRLPITRTFKGNRKKVRVIASSKKIAEIKVKDSF